jgi:hypothetical protein
MSLRLTDHARARLQQRAIPMPILDCLLNYGTKVHDHRGGEIIFFDHQAKNRLRRAYGEYEFKCVERKLDTYAVVGSDGVVLTVGHRTKRINRW